MENGQSIQVKHEEKWYTAKVLRSVATGIRVRYTSDSSTELILKSEVATRTKLDGCKLLSGSSFGKMSGRGQRKRKARFITIDGHTVLKANNYGLEEGISTFSNSASSQRRRALPKIRAAQNPYSIFIYEMKFNLATAPAAWSKLASP